MSDGTSKSDLAVNALLILMGLAMAMPMPWLPYRFPSGRLKDLACWCALDAPCHADVLLELANK